MFYPVRYCKRGKSIGLVQMGRKVAKAVLGSGLQGRRRDVCAGLAWWLLAFWSGFRQMAAAEQCWVLGRDGCLLLSGAPGPGVVSLVAAADLHSDVLCVAVPSVALSYMKNLLLLRAHCRFLAC